MAKNLWQTAIVKCEMLIDQVLPQKSNDILKTDSKALIDYVVKLQTTYADKAPNKAIQRLGPFLVRLKSMACAIDLFSQIEPKIGGVIWGCLRFLLEVRSWLRSTSIVL